jgi:hypothetical protein
LTPLKSTTFWGDLIIWASYGSKFFTAVNDSYLWFELQAVNVMIQLHNDNYTDLLEP